MPNSTIPASDLELLRRYDTPTICNVVELFDVRPRTAGYMDGRILACFPKMPPMVGYASTATFRSAFAPAPATSIPASPSRSPRLRNCPARPSSSFRTSTSLSPRRRSAR